MIDTTKKYTCINRQVEFIGENSLVVCGKIRGSPEDLFFIWHKDTGAPYHCNTSPLKEIEEPACVPWTAADVPWPWPAVRLFSACAKFAISGVSDKGVFLCARHTVIRWKVLADDYEYTTDGKTWLPCRKEK